MYANNTNSLLCMRHLQYVGGSDGAEAFPQSNTENNVL